MIDNDFLDNFALRMNDYNKSVSDFLFDFSQHEYEISHGDFTHAKEYVEEKAFITRLEQDITFCATSFHYAFDFGDTEMSVRGLMPAEETTDMYRSLTLSSDEFRNFIASHSCSVEFFKDGDRVCIDDTVELLSNHDKSVLIDIIPVENVNEDMYDFDMPMTDLLKAMENAERKMAELGIDIKNEDKSVYAQTNTVFLDKKIHNELIDLEYDKEEKKLVIEEKRELEEPAEVIESSDGEVLNTSKQTAATVRAVSEKVKDGEVVNNAAPRETTSDISAVRGNVKLEQANAVGSKEKAQVDAGRGTDYDIDKLADQSEGYESQSDRPKKKVVDFDLD